MIQRITITTPGRGLHEVTDEVSRVVADSGVTDGLCTVFVRHTSASILIQENADPSARHDLEAWFDQHVPDGYPRFTHTAEGPDDMPSHIRAAITATSIVVPVDDCRLTLGTWQGIYLFEHRMRPHTRQLVIHVA